MESAIAIDERAVLSISQALHTACIRHGTSTLWLALDGSSRSLPQTDESLSGWAARVESCAVQLRHPEIDPVWWPRWFTLNLDRAEDSHLLNQSIAWALDESQPHSIRRGLGRRVSGWLLVDGPVAQATVHWATQMLQTHPVRGRRLLRLHDPAVLWAFWRLLPVVQHPSWLGPVRAWWLLDPLGRLDALHRAGPSGARLPADIDATRWQDIDDIGAFNHALQFWLGAPREARRGSLDACVKTGFDALRRARALGIDDTPSLQRFCELALTRHPRFDQHPLVRERLSRLAQDERLGVLLSALTPEDWHRVATESPDENTERT